MLKNIILVIALLVVTASAEQIVKNTFTENRKVLKGKGIHIPINPDGSIPEIVVKQPVTLEERQLNLTGIDGINFGTDSDDFFVIVDDIVNIALQIWDLVESNAGSYDASVDYADAVPEGVTDWTQLAGWTDATEVGSGSFKTVDSTFGWDCCQFDYSVQFQYDGNYNGVGQYITRAAIVPTYVKVSWGYTLAASVDTSVYNAGTSEEPIGAITMDLYTSCTMFNTADASTTFTFQGDGGFTAVNN